MACRGRAARQRLQQPEEPACGAAAALSGAGALKLVNTEAGASLSAAQVAAIFKPTTETKGVNHETAFHMPVTNASLLQATAAVKPRVMSFNSRRRARVHAAAPRPAAPPAAGTACGAHATNPGFTHLALHPALPSHIEGTVSLVSSWTACGRTCTPALGSTPLAPHPKMQTHMRRYCTLSTAWRLQQMLSSAQHSQPVVPHAHQYP